DLCGGHRASGGPTAINNHLSSGIINSNAAPTLASCLASARCGDCPNASGTCWEMGVVAQTPHGNAYFCSLIQKNKNPFLNMMAIEQVPSTNPQNGIDWTMVIPPPEFQRHRLIEAKAVSPRTSFWPQEPPSQPAEECDFTHTNVQGSIH